MGYKRTVYSGYLVLTRTLIVYLLFLSLPFDMLNGILLNKGIILPVSVAQVYKFIIIILFFCSFFFNPNSLVVTSTLFLLLILPTVYQYTKLNNSVELNLFSDIVKIFRYLMLVLSFFFFVPLLKKNNQNANKVLFRIVFLSYIILAGNVFIKYIGFGYPMYEFGDIGSKGYFYAGNEISALLVILSSIIAMNLWREKKKGLYVLFFLLTALVGLGISSKTGLFGIIITFLLIPLKPVSFKTRLGNIFITSIIILITIPFILYFAWEYIKTTEMFVRLVYFYDKHDLLTFLFSSRNVYLSDAFNVYMQEYNQIEKLIGVGQTKYEYLNDGKIVEIDILDIFFAYGLIGLLLFLGLIGFLLAQAKRFARNRKYPYASFVFLMLLILLAISSSAGHVFSSGMSAVFIGFLFSLMYIKIQDEASK